MEMKIFLHIFACLFLWLDIAGAGLVWRPGEGWSRESDGAVVAASDAKEQLLLARKLESEEKWGDALEAYKMLVRRWPLSSVAGESQFKEAFMLEKLAKFDAAFKAYSKVVSKYPGSQFFDLSLERQYAIANLFLAGERQRFLDIPLLPSMDKAVDMYNGLIKSAPYGKYAAPAYFKIGLAREKQKNWSEAIASYNTIIDKYPGHGLADDAQYQIGYAWYRASSDADYDQSAARKSVAAFQDFLTKFPNSEKVSQAQDYINELTERQVQGSYNIARFYEKQKNYKSAFIYYNDVIKINPQSKMAEEAKQRIDVIRPELENSDFPLIGSSEETTPSEG